MLQADQVVGNLKLAEAATNLKQWDKVESYYKTALAADPKSYRSLFAIGGFYSPMQGAKNTIWRKSWHVMRSNSTHHDRVDILYWRSSWCSPTGMLK